MSSSEDTPDPPPRSSADQGAPADHESSEAAERLGISTGKVGLAPGSVIYTGEQYVDHPIVSTITYTPGDVHETSPADVASLRTPTGPEDGVHWIDVVGLHDTDLIIEIGKRFGLHPLLLEDVVSIRGRPTFVDYENHAFISVKMLTWSTADKHVEVEHISLVMGDDYVMSFQERPGDVFDSVRSRIRGGTTRIRRRDAEYLWYALLDAVVDHYLYVIERLASLVDELEASVWNGEEVGSVPSRVQALRNEMVAVRRALRPLRDEIESIVKEPPEWFSEEIPPFMADLKAQVLHISDALESMRESLSGIMDAHLSLVSMRTNEVMKVLTIMASIFIPLTFVAGIYGMNFQYMPELDEAWAYPMVWVVMISIGVALVAYFRRKGWM